MNIAQSIRDVLPAKVGIAAFFGAIVIGLVGAFYDIPLRVLVRDPAAEFDFPSYAGLFTYIGVGIMVAASAVTCFATVLLKHLSGRYNKTLLATSIFSILLAFDDLFMLHELASRLGEVFFFACLGLAMLAILYFLTKESNDHDLRGLYWALGFLGLSVITDIFKVYGPFAYWLEDFSKLAGMAGWLAFWSSFSKTEVLVRLTSRA